MRAATVTAIFGRRGSGKTTRARALVEACPRLVTFDPIGEWATWPDFDRCDTLAAVRAELARGWRSGFRLAYVPPGDPCAAFHGLADLIWRASSSAPAVDRRRPLVVVADELNLALPNRPLRRGQDAGLRLVLQGRHRGVGVVGISQRPAAVSADFRGQAIEVYAFHLPSDLDRTAIAGVIGREHAEQTARLAEHEFLHFAGGRVRRGRNPPIGRHTRGRGG